METRYQKHPKLVDRYLRLARARASRVSSEYRTVKLPFPSLLDLLDFTTDQGDRTKTKRDGRKKKGKGKRRRQKAKRSAEPISEAAESLLALLSLLQRSQLFFRSMPAKFSWQVSCPGILPGLLCPDSLATVRYRTYAASLLRLPRVFSYVYLVVSLPPPLIPLLLSMPFSHGYIPLFVRRRRR